jgi:hypothetical protein
MVPPQVARSDQRNSPLETAKLVSGGAGAAATEGEASLGVFAGGADTAAASLPEAATAFVSTAWQALRQTADTIIASMGHSDPTCALLEIVITHPLGNSLPESRAHRQMRFTMSYNALRVV